MTAPDRVAALPASQLSRRDAIRLWLGQGDQIALEREQLSAIESARGYAPAEPAAEEAAAAEPPRRKPVCAPASRPFSRLRERLRAIRVPVFGKRGITPER